MKLLYFEFKTPSGILVVDNTNPRLPQLYDNFKLLNMTTNFDSLESIKDAEPVSCIDQLISDETNENQSITEQVVKIGA
jgi:hypothetical protein